MTKPAAIEMRIAGRPASTSSGGSFRRGRQRGPWLLAVVAAWSLSSLAFAGTAGADEPLSERFAIAIHGGVGGDPDSLPDALRQQRERSLTAALRRGQAMLAEGRSSLDVVEQVIRLLEDEPAFNAGRGAVMNSRGGHELDASIMDGRNRDCGAVAGVTRVKNPISLARLVMTETRHVLLSGDGADDFARHMRVDLVDNSYFTTEAARQGLQRARQQAAERREPAAPTPRSPNRGSQDQGSQDQGSQNEADDAHRGTVGCVVLDRHGNLAAGTSTGGLTNKLYGRVGDSPLIGAGTYADNATCGVSCTGVGEHFIRHAVAYDISARMAYKQQSLEDAVTQVVDRTLKKNQGGVIAVDNQGRIVIRFNTPGMSRAAADSQGRFEVHVGS